MATILAMVHLVFEKEDMVVWVTGVSNKMSRISGKPAMVDLAPPESSVSHASCFFRHPFAAVELMAMSEHVCLEQGMFNLTLRMT
jgi:hypothetical protein